MRQTPALSPDLQAVEAVRGLGRRDVSQTLPIQLVRIMEGIISFETLLLLFVFAGAFKNMPELRRFPAYIALVFCTLSLSAAILLRTSRECPLRDLNGSGFILYAVFLAWALFSLMWV
jgi:hypothetical protein